MQYAELLRNDMVIGSGLVEAAVKRLITLRMKRTGATWTEDGGDAIIALRAAFASAACGISRGRFTCRTNGPRMPPKRSHECKHAKLHQICARAG
jgi:hypothetical protein